MTIHKRTAVLCVHGIGNQRAQETVRGIVEAVWFDETDPPDNSGNKKVWTHPERSTDDIDLVVMTTSPSKAQDQRSIDFHELYWAHLMSETRSVAIVLWLFELVRKGPLLRPGLNALWYVGAIFLALLVASVTLLGVHVILRLAHVTNEPEALLLAPFLTVAGVAAYSAIFAGVRLAWRLFLPLVLIAAIAGVVFYFGINLDEQLLHLLASMFLPLLIALVLTAVIMGWNGLKILVVTYLFSFGIYALYWHARYLINIDRNNILADLLQQGWEPFRDIWNNGWLPLSLNENWSAVSACVIVALYLLVNATFLQSYLGDAARYFRNSPGNVLVRREIRSLAINTLKYLHTCGLYDRIIVVAHSQGTVVAYDMLRAYFSQVVNSLPAPAKLGPDLAKIDDANVDPKRDDPLPEQDEFRAAGRRLIAEIANLTAGAGSDESSNPWLVTDFVTLGSPLTHAHYLMCKGDTREQLEDDFQRRVREREFPTCPPKRLDKDGTLTFVNPNTGQSEFHHGAVFGLTRWTNLYFPVGELLWGDAIGGPLKGVFGTYIRDIKVSNYDPPRDSFFAHNLYWNISKGWKAPQIAALRKAVNLADV